MRPPVSMRNCDAQRRLNLRLSEIVHLDEEPLATEPLAGRVDPDDAADHVGRDRHIRGDALCGRLCRIPVHRDRRFPFRRQGDPVMAEVRAVGEKGQDSVFANIWGAIIERKRAVVSPQARHRVQVAPVCESSMVARQQLEHFGL